MVHEQLTSFSAVCRRDAHPDGRMMVGIVGALAAFYQDGLDINNADHRRIAEFRLISKISDDCGYVLPLFQRFTVRFSEK